VLKHNGYIQYHKCVILEPSQYAVVAEVDQTHPEGQTTETVAHTESAQAGRTGQKNIGRSVKSLQKYTVKDGT